MAELNLALEEAAVHAVNFLRDALRDRTRDDADLKLARIASTTVAAHTRLKQVESAREATMVTMMSHSTESAEAFRRLVAASLPGSPVAQALLKEGGS